MVLPLKRLEMNKILMFWIFTFLSHTFYYCQASDSLERTVFRAPLEKATSNILEFTNIAIEKNKNGFIYVGGRNRLFQLDSNLKEHVKTVETGPVTNDIICNCQDAPKDNLNKILLIDYRYDRIIVCGSVEQGVCELRQKNDLNNVLWKLDRNKITAGQYHVAASGNLSTVGFLASSISGKEYLFVGSSKIYNDEKALKDKSKTTFYTISKRSLPEDASSNEMFSNEVSVYGLLYYYGILMKEKNYAESNYRVNFIDGFATDITGYFVTTHPISNTPPYEKKDDGTYISQVCLYNEFPDLDSYLELPLQCDVQGFKYLKAVAARSAKIGTLLQAQLGVQSSDNEVDVVFISFVQSDPSRGSAVCLFTLSEIEEKFVQLASNCMRKLNGEIAHHIPWILKENIECNSATINVQSPACSQRNKAMWKDVVRHLQGNIYEKRAVFKTTDTVITAIEIALTRNRDHTVAFFGTENGKVLKVRLDSNELGSQEINLYEVITVDPNAQPSFNSDVKSKLLVKSIQLSYSPGENGRFYVLTPAVIVGMPLFNCSKYKTCSECLGSNDPFCGWCTLHNRCSSSENCEVKESSNSYQFLSNGENCPKLFSDNPLVLTVSQSEKKIQLKGINIPSTSDLEYRFQFGDFYSYKINSLTPLPNNKSLIRIPCVTPPRKKIPKFPKGQGYLTVPLKLEYVTGGARIEITRTDYTFYNCSIYTSCIVCVNSSFQCSWCLEDNSCTDQSSNICPQHNVQFSDNCPQITRDNHVFLPQKSKQHVRIAVTKLIKSWESFVCEIDFGRNPQNYRGIRDGSSVVCQNVESVLPARVRSINASLRITTMNTGPRIEIDNPYNVTVEVFRCDLIDDRSCGKCLESPARWGCGWCPRDKKCTRRVHCDRNDWLETSGTNFCPNPQIYRFSPGSAPIGGNSTIELEGVNFNAKMQISIDTVECRVYSSNCCRARCTAHAPVRTAAPLVLCIPRNGHNCIKSPAYTTETKESFRFVDPIIDSFLPSRALTGWGTVVKIKGRDLDAGNTVVISVANRPCRLLKRSASSIECQLDCSSNRRRRDVGSRVLERLSRPGRSTSTNGGRVSVVFDQKERPSKTGFFSFSDVVTISSIQPDTTIRSGGLPLFVTGKNLNLIQNPQMEIPFMQRSFLSDCTIMNSTTIKCPSPDLHEANLNELSPLNVIVKSEHCQSVFVSSDQKVAYEPNPDLDVFDGAEKTKIYRAESIYITGERLCPEPSFCDPSTIRVLIMDGSTALECNVTRLDMDQITCQPPDAELGTYTVQVHIGGYSQEIGYLKYDQQQEFAVPLGIAVVIVIVVVVVIVAFLVYRYRKRADAQEMQLKKKELQLNEMEASVAKVCREGFAELQTLIAEEDNYGETSIPFLPYRKYILRVLFPDLSTSDESYKLLSSSLDAREPIQDRMRMTMSGLKRLINNKTFLILLIRTLENQKTFSAKDRGRVAALILIILHDRLEYATSILEHLLADLIRRDLESNKHPRILFRRSETVAEKMLTHWFSILLFGFVQECVGEPFYTLCRAIKQQVNRGPVDVFTNEARYSLSEDKLLRRRSITLETISLRVFNYLTSYEKSELVVKVLSCDSISQVKQKIVDVAYANVPFSDCPKIDTLDIELKRRKIILRDEDKTSKVEGEWKQVNTLAHYQVQNNDVIDLIPKSYPTIPRPGGIRQNGNDVSLMQSANSSTSSLGRNKQASRSGTPTSTIQGESKFWHLVPPSDHDPTEGTLERTNKLVSEIYFTTLLTTKGTLQRYVDNLFETIFSVTQRGHDLPMAVKHLFDFLDQQAMMHSITDSEIVYQWKSNCLPLRFWVNLIKNPDFVFDIHKSPISDCFLSVIAQAFMDSCSTENHQLSKDSPSNKLLYAKEIKEYQKWVSRYYRDIKSRPRLVRRDLSAFLLEQSALHSQDFNTEGALSMLYEYIDKYSDDFLVALDREPEAKRQNLYNHFIGLKSAWNGRS